MARQLSIITITYNAEAFLERTLKSISANLASLAPDQRSLVEYIIIDGASKDTTLAIAQSYHAIINQLVSEPDKGLYDAMNKGLKLATGEYVWFMNAGDEIHDSEVLARLFPLLSAKADVYYSDALFVNNDGAAVGLRSEVTPHSLPRQLTWKDMALGMKVCHQAFIAKRALAPLYDVKNLSADIGWEIDILKRSKQTYFLAFILCKYLTGGISVQKHRKSLVDRFNVLSKHFGFLPTLWNHVLIVLRSILRKMK